MFALPVGWLVLVNLKASRKWSLKYQTFSCCFLHYDKPKRWKTRQRFFLLILTLKCEGLKKLSICFIFVHHYAHAWRSEATCGNWFFAFHLVGPIQVGGKSLYRLTCEVFDAFIFMFCKFQVFAYELQSRRFSKWHSPRTSESGCKFGWCWSDEYW